MAEKLTIQQRVLKNALDHTVDGKTFLEGETPQVEFLVPGCIPKACVIVIAGESDGGKSFVAYATALAVAGGTQWLGRGVPVEKPGTVLFLNYDNPTDTLKFRLVKLGFNSKMSFEVHTQGLAPKMLVLPGEQERLKIIIEHIQPSFIIVDSLRQSNTFNENDSQEMAAYMSIIKSWTNVESKPAVAIIHHTAKGSNNENAWKTSARGSGEIISSADVVLQVSDRSLLWSKTRQWEIGKRDEDRSCSFEIVDTYIDNPLDEDDIIHRIVVRATSALPGEELRMIEDTLMKAFDSKFPLGRDEIYKKCQPLKKQQIDTALKRAIANKKIKYKKTNSVRLYVKV